MQVSREPEKRSPSTPNDPGETTNACTPNNDDNNELIIECKINLKY